MKAKCHRLLLGNNLKFLRSENDLTQKEFSNRTGVSYRLVQELESGSANPTLDTLEKLAGAFSLATEDLLSLNRVRLQDGDIHFIERYIEKFKDAAVGAGIRDLNGMAIWANKKRDQLYGSQTFQRGPVDLLEVLPQSNREILKNQMLAEKNGLAHPYTLVHVHPETGEKFFLRCHPTLIFPYKGRTPVYTSVYFVEIEKGYADQYYEYCKRLLGALYV